MAESQFTTPTVAQSDTPKILFTTEVRPQAYGDNRTFFEYRILMHHRGNLAGVEEGPRRTTADRRSALRLARIRIKELQQKPLFVIRITRKHISDGTARSCRTCAIAQALWHNQERMGLQKREFRFDVSPYGAFCAPRGIVLEESWGDEVAAIPAELMPDMAISGRDGRAYSDPMAEWAMHFDDWAESRFMSAKEWREERDPDGKPGRPGPCSFVLDASALLPRPDQPTGGADA